jgi:hypothetical protein
MARNTQKQTTTFQPSAPEFGQPPLLSPPFK